MWKRLRGGKSLWQRILTGKLMVRLDIAESILRREANGIWFEPVKVAGRSR